LPRLQVGPFHRIVGHVEEKRLAENPEIFPVADARRALPERLVAPEQAPLDRRRPLFKLRQQVDAIGREGGIRSDGRVGCSGGSPMPGFVDPAIGSSSPTGNLV
jgi:hypothetical protein